MDYNKKNKIEKAEISSKKWKINMLLTFFRILFICTFILSAFYIIKWEINNKQNSKITNTLLQYVSSTDTSSKNINKDFFVDFDNLTSINDSCFAWLIVNGTNINYPVVQASDNSYYLTHSFDKSYNLAGWIYADYKNSLDGADKNLVIFGHNRRDGSMFSTLKNILNESWYLDENNLTISLYTKNGLEEYKVFSVYQVKVEDYYINTTFASETSYKTFFNNLKNRSIYNFNVDVFGEDNILTLSTCSNNNKYRTVLHAKKYKLLN